MYRKWIVQIKTPVQVGNQEQFSAKQSATYYRQIEKCIHREFIRLTSIYL